MEFNKKSRKRNAILTSGAGVINQLCNVIFSFVYRTIFLYILSVEYLGISGLFSNIMQVFSLAELGIGSVIVYRMYQPIKDGNINKTASLMNFYKNFYHTLGVGILVFGVLLIPFLPYLIHDLNEVPDDVSINTIYFLYVFQSASSYLFVYKQSLLQADQKGYMVALLGAGTIIIKNAVLILVLVMSHNYTLTLTAGIFTTIIINFSFNFYITAKYKEVFESKERLDKEERLSIFKDTLALVCHKIGQTIVFTSDNLVLSAFVGVAAVGRYSNYSLIILSVAYILNAIMGEFTSSIGNFMLSADMVSKKKLYERLLFLNMWLTSFCTVALYELLNPFIQVWKGQEYLFNREIVLLLSIDFFIRTSRIINGSFINAAGLFVKDRGRPLIEAGINLILSIVLVKKIGIAGVFIGTIVSVLLTAWWREPYLLKKYLIQNSLWRYYLLVIRWSMLSILVVMVIDNVFAVWPLNFMWLVLRFMVCAVIANAFYTIFMWRNSDFRYYIVLIKRLITCKWGKI
ncbi:MAG: hypothetical protein HFI33_10610 [Lachnospiraceae bacterium]|nr:hypothetical protein [Lachnospiraceae bacterium]